MNEQLTERFGRSKRAVREQTRKVDVWLLPQKLNPKIREYFERGRATGGNWLSRPEIPSTEELLDTDANSLASEDIVEIPPNKPKGAFDDIEHYLSTHYELLREDATRPLREAVSKIKFTPAANEDSFQGQIGIYDKVHIYGTVLSTRGVAMRITFSLVRTGKQIIWEQSKRLITGSLVVLTPVDNMFESKALVATVAARPLSGLQQNPPEVDLFFARAEEIEIDPAKEYVMIEERSGFYEADRHTLVALQHMKNEPFPLSEHLVHVQCNPSAPEYVKTQPRMKLTATFINNKHDSYENIDVLRRWPMQPQSELDTSQREALHRMLTKRLSIIQGPPGTGKTHVSVQAIKIMLENRSADDPPIIMACHTNHAIDQILRLIAPFEPDFIRLGGRSKDRNIIKPRTLYEVRKETSENPPAGCMFGMAKKKMADIDKELGFMLTPLKPGKQPLDHRVLESFKILSKAQADSLENGASQWVRSMRSNPNEARSPFLVWLGEKLIVVPPKQEPEDFGFEFEEADLAFEQLKELEAENAAKDDEEIDTLRGLWLPLADNFTCRRVPGVGNAKAEDLIKEEDLWKIPEASRGAVYRHLQAEMKNYIAVAFRDKAKLYNEHAMKRRIGNWERDEPILRRAKIIGMTTTGLSKYRALVAALQPKIVLIEEAAETLEAPVTAACVPSIQQLILVGDHQQLRPHTHVKSHEDKPFYLNISLFERLVNNGIQYSRLEKQRRMIPEIRRLLWPIYKNQIKDHPSVKDPENRPNVPGMGGVNSFFFTHQWNEERDNQMSCLNRKEADMVVGMFEHLAYNGMDPEDITVLTFYNGQRKRILAELRARPTFAGESRFNVVTVDSYQGEENKVVLLSLVRSNEHKQIGFLDVANRVCVALSRAQWGLYIFGNGELLHGKSKLWQSVVQIMSGAPMQRKELDRDRPINVRQRLGMALPICCSNHNKVVAIEEPEHWEAVIGGCDTKCDGKLPCGHDCQAQCHPMPHEMITCRQCPPTQFADPIMSQQGNGTEYAYQSEHSRAQSRSDPDPWHSYAEQESARAEKLKGEFVPRSQREEYVTIDLQRAALAHQVRELNLSLDGTSGCSVESSEAVRASAGDDTRHKWKDTLPPANFEEEEENLIDLGSDA